MAARHGRAGLASIRRRSAIVRRESRPPGAALYIGSCILAFRLPGNDSLKGKRRASRSLIERLRHRFNVAAAEVDAVGEHRRLVIGVVCVSNDYSHAAEMLDKAAAFAEAHPSDAELVSVERSVDAADRG